MRFRLPLHQRIHRTAAVGAAALCLWGAILPSAAAEPPKSRLSLDLNLYTQGRYVYERNCLICHGDRGDGKGEMAKDLPLKPRSFREGWFKFRSTPFDKLPTDDDLRRTIRGGLSGTAMGMFNQLGDDDVKAVIEYLKSLSRRWRHAENYAPAIEFPEPPEWLADAKARTGHAAEGQVIFSTICAACHGSSGEGNGPAGQALKDAWGQPIRPADLREQHLRCGDGPADIFRILTTGMSGTPMVSFSATLSAEQRWDIVAYVLSLRANKSQPANP